MAAYGSNPGNPGGGGGGGDMYSDAEPSAAKAPTEEKEEKGDGETALIPKSLCPDMHPGEEVVLRIVRGLENDWEVEYAPEKGKEEEAPAEAPMPAGGGGEGGGSSMESNYG